MTWIDWLNSSGEPAAAWFFGAIIFAGCAWTGIKEYREERRRAAQDEIDQARRMNLIFESAKLSKIIADDDFKAAVAERDRNLALKAVNRILILD